MKRLGRNLLLFLVAFLSPADAHHREVGIIVESGSLSYCDHSSEIAVARLRVPVTFTNVSKKPLILAREAGPDERVRVVNQKGKIVYAPDPHYLSTRIIRVGDVPDPATFETVAPGASTQREFILVFPTSKDTNSPAPFTLLPGVYFVSARLSTWPIYADEAVAQEARKRWRHLGELVIAPVTLKRLRFTISIPSQMPPCR